MVNGHVEKLGNSKFESRFYAWFKKCFGSIAYYVDPEPNFIHKATKLERDSDLIFGQNQGSEVGIKSYYEWLFIQSFNCQLHFIKIFKLNNLFMKYLTVAKFSPIPN